MKMILFQIGEYLLNNADRYVYKVPELMISGNDEERNQWLHPKGINKYTPFGCKKGRYYERSSIRKVLELF